MRLVVLGRRGNGKVQAVREGEGTRGRQDGSDDANPVPYITPSTETSKVLAGHEKVQVAQFSTGQILS